LAPASAIAEVDAHAIDREDFDRSIRAAGQPVVLRRLATDWPAVAAAQGGDSAVLARLAQDASARPVTVLVGAPEIDGRFFYADGLASFNFGHGRAPLTAFFAELLRERGVARPRALAIQSEFVPDLLPEFSISHPCQLVDNAVEPRVWIGNRVRVAPHFDLNENIGIVVAGRRRFTLFPPSEIANLYAGPFEFTPAGTPISLVELANPDLERFPRFATAWANAQSAELGPGDAIYIPYLWWHGVDSLDAVNVFINYWWSDARDGLGSPYDALLHALYAFRHLPENQRAAWRTIVDHYAFAADGDPGAHLPATARGIVGDLEPGLLDRMRATLQRNLDPRR
jgi:hypothetical protein